MADDTQRRTCACCQKKAKDGGVDGERIPLDQALCGGCRGKRCLGRCGRKLEAGDVLNTCRTCAASVADALGALSANGELEPRARHRARVARTRLEKATKEHAK